MELQGVPVQFSSLPLTESKTVDTTKPTTKPTVSPSSALPAPSDRFVKVSSKLNALSVGGDNYSNFSDIVSNVYSNTIPLDISSLIIHNTSLELLNGLKAYNNLVILDLSNNQIINPEIIFSTTLVNVRYLNLSCNRISSFFPRPIMTSCSCYVKQLEQTTENIHPRLIHALHCSRAISSLHNAQINIPKLEFLYLDQNCIESIEDLNYLEKCPKLQYLCLRENQITTIKDYRKKIAEMFSWLSFLDGYILSVHEKYPKLITRQCFPVNFQPSLNTFLMTNFQSNDYLLKLLNDDSETLKKLYEHHSPILICQRFVRSWRKRRRSSYSYYNIFRMVKFIQDYARRWKKKLQLKIELEDILKSTENADLLCSYSDILIGKKVNNIARHWLEKTRLSHESKCKHKLVRWAYRYYPKYMQAKKKIMSEGMYTYFSEKQKEDVIDALAKHCLTDIIGRKDRRKAIEERICDSGARCLSYLKGSNIRLYSSLLHLRKESWEKITAILETDIDRLTLLHRNRDITKVTNFDERRFIDHMKHLVQRLRYSEKQVQRIKVAEELHRASHHLHRLLFTLPDIHPALQRPILRRMKVNRRKCPTRNNITKVLVYCHETYADYLRCQWAIHKTMESNSQGQRDKSNPEVMHSFLRIKQINAVLLLQGLWRGYKVRKHKCVRQEILFYRACKLIQRWWRYTIGIRCRFLFTHIIRIITSMVTTNCLYIETDLLNLLLHEGNFEFLIKSVLKLKTASLLGYRISSKQKKIIIQNNYCTDAKMNLYRLSECTIELEKCNGIKSNTNTSKWITNRVNELLLSGTKVIAEPYTTDQNLNSTDKNRDNDSNSDIDGKNEDEALKTRRTGEIKKVVRSLQTNFDIKFSQIVFDDVEEARRRAIVLFAKTFDIRTMFFAAFYSEEMLDLLNNALLNGGYEDDRLMYFAKVFPIQSTNVFNVFASKMPHIFSSLLSDKMINIDTSDTLDTFDLREREDIKRLPEICVIQIKPTIGVNNRHDEKKKAATIEKQSTLDAISLSSQTEKLRKKKMDKETTERKYQQIHQPHPPARPRSPFNRKPNSAHSGFNRAVQRTTCCEEEADMTEKKENVRATKLREERVLRALDIEKRLKAKEIAMDTAAKQFEAHARNMRNTFTKDIENSKMNEKRLEEKIQREKQKKNTELSKQLSSKYTSIARKINHIISRKQRENQTNEIQEKAKIGYWNNKEHQKQVKREKMMDILAKQTKTFEEKIWNAEKETQRKKKENERIEKYKRTNRQNEFIKEMLQEKRV